MHLLNWEVHLQLCCVLARVEPSVFRLLTRFPPPPFVPDGLNWTSDRYFLCEDFTKPTSRGPGILSFHSHNYVVGHCPHIFALDVTELCQTGLKTQSLRDAYGMECDGERPLQEYPQTQAQAEGEESSKGETYQRKGSTFVFFF